MRTVYKLTKEDVKMLEEAGFGKGEIRKGDYIACHLAKGTKRQVIELFAKNDNNRGLCVHTYHPLEKDQVAFAFLGEKYYELGKGGKAVWEDFSKKVIRANAEMVLGGKYSKKSAEAGLKSAFYLDGATHSFDSEESFNPRSVDIDEYMSSAADFAIYGKLADEVEELALKYDKHSKKLNKIFDEISKIRPEEKEQDDVEEEMEM